MKETNKPRLGNRVRRSGVIADVSPNRLKYDMILIRWDDGAEDWMDLEDLELLPDTQMFYITRIHVIKTLDELIEKANQYEKLKDDEFYRGLKKVIGDELYGPDIYKGEVL